MEKDKIVKIKKIDSTTKKSKKKVKQLLDAETQPIETMKEIKEITTEVEKETKVDNIIEKENTKVESKPTVKKKKRRRLNKKTLLICFLILIPIISLSVIFLTDKGKKPVEEPKKEIKKVKKEKPVEEETPKLKIVDEESTSRPFAVMINNVGVARPLQSGLQDAYIIYEIIVEGGITRYMALFLDQDTSRIGSIRSSRHYYLDYALENDAIYVHHGQSPQALSDFGTLGVDRIVADNSKTGWRDKSLNVSSEHTLFTSIAKLKNGIGNKRTTRNKDLLLNYSIEPLDLKSIENSKEANKVSINYSNTVTSSYEYDSSNKVYKRFVNGKEHKDYATKKQYTFKNIITYQVANYTIAGDDKGRQNLNNIGSGSGYYISEGIAIPIKWSKSSRREQTKYYFENGEELKVNDGNTFIQLQPKGRNLSIS